jgi:hypothetical protein
MHKDVDYMSRQQMAPKCGRVGVPVHLFMISVFYMYTVLLALRLFHFLI